MRFPLVLSAFVASLCLSFIAVFNSSAATTTDFSIVWSYPAPSADLPGRIFQPQQARDNPGKTYPIIIFFHGSGEWGTNNTNQINGNLDNLLAAAKTNGFYIYAPQSTNSAGSWGEPYRVAKAFHMLSQAVHAYNIDPTRIYVTGLSSGGGGCWVALAANQDVYAAAVPIAGFADITDSFSFTSGAPARLVDIPIWAFHSADDNTVQPLYTRNNLNYIRVAEGRSNLTFPINSSSEGYVSNLASNNYTGSYNTLLYSYRGFKYSEFSSGGHGIWTRAYADFDGTLYPWLLGSVKNLPPLNGNNTVLINFGADQGVDNLGRYWNNAGGVLAYGSNDYRFKTLSEAVDFAYTTTGARTAVSLLVTKPFFEAKNVTSDSTLYPTNVVTTCWTVGDGFAGNASSLTKPGQFKIQGLVPSATYKITLFGSNKTVNDWFGKTVYNVQSSANPITVDTRDNISTTAVFNSVTATSSGEITVDVVVKEGNSRDFFGVISAMEITAVSNISSWRTQNFGSSANSGNGADLADPDNDGIVNLLEYGLGSNPNLNNSATVLCRTGGDRPCQQQHARPSHVHKLRRCARRFGQDGDNR